MILDIFLIAVASLTLGLASIPFGFTLTNDPFVVYFGNALGSLVAAIVFLYFSSKIISRFMKRRKKTNDAKKTAQVGSFIDKHGVRLFGLVCPLFPGVTFGVPAAIALELDMKKFKRWLFVGIFVVSAGYVFLYYWTIVR